MHVLTQGFRLSIQSREVIVEASRPGPLSWTGVTCWSHLLCRTGVSTICVAMGLQGYVGGAEDVQRIRRQEKQREEEKKKFEEKKKRSDANVDAAGLKTFGAGKLEVRLHGLLQYHLLRIGFALLLVPHLQGKLPKKSAFNY